MSLQYRSWFSTSFTIRKRQSYTSLRKLFWTEKYLKSDSNVSVKLQETGTVRQVFRPRGSCPPFMLAQPAFPWTRDRPAATGAISGRMLSLVRGFCAMYNPYNHWKQVCFHYLLAAVQHLSLILFSILFVIINPLTCLSF